MFSGEKYISKGIAQTIPPFIQNILWYLIDTIPRTTNKDYMQVFELSATTQDGKHKQKILHYQENPPYSDEYIITVKNPVKSKIYIIDDSKNSTMILAEEY